MKIKTQITFISRFALVLGCFLAMFFSVVAADKQSKGKVTPKGGRLLEKTEPHAEFFVEKDGTVSIHFYNQEMKPVPAANQVVTVMTEAKAGKTRLEFGRTGDSLVSKSKLPPGDGYNVVVQFKQTPESKVQNFRFKLELRTCGECQRPEYGCTCGH